MLRGKRIWLIGASEGIGAELAKALAAEGALLILSARNTQRLGALLPALMGGDHRVVTLDVSAAGHVADAWEKVAPLTPDIVIYNAGAYEPMGAREFDLARVEQMIDVNFSGALRVLAHVLPAMLKRHTGHIVLVASVAGYRGLPRAMGYGASKAALLHLAENLKTDLEETPLKVQVVNPGFVKTRLTDKNDFAMPFMITPEVAAQEIIKGLKSDCFDIHFPKRFTYVLKFMRLLPYPLYFWALRKLL
jgi:short-subunit dehydrogenase